jgi:hypothetical protein
MKHYAPVGPIAVLEELYKKGYLARYELVLAHDVIKHPLRYKALFHGKGHFIILDNSSVELGHPMSSSLLLDAANYTAANVVALPDFLHDKDKTVEAVKLFWKKLSNAERSRYAWMGIPQGRDLDEFEECVIEICKILQQPPRFWGVPRWIANEWGSRAKAVKILQHRLYRPLGHDSTNHDYIHILGMSNNLADDIRCVRMPYVMGIDSANPIVLGLHGFEIGGEVVHMDRGDYWDATGVPELSLRNIESMRNLINGRAELPNAAAATGS